MPTLAQLRELQSIAQAGLTYTKDDYDRDRYVRLRDLTAELLAEQTGQAPAEVTGLLRIEEGYLTPKVDVRAIVLNPAGEVLLTRERADGRWSLPGGWADPGESPREIAVREVREETGRTVRAVRLLAVLDKGKHPHPADLWAVYKLFIHCDLVGSEGSGHVANTETTDSGWFLVDALPPLSLGRNLPEQVQRAVELARNPGLGVDVD
ncbi:ADP-ribose pyrophosphatase YjhB (NUDIX family) [Deinococcus metalli]|uniref:ADP-ribose pyrophosphatase YjhB (NUDIX family) n=1 Tax=Deinococcus metalli TaxID=1141878 RepID=A0A7W8KE00_9DEIO|nr:NUDIX hydrolase [Deinococcus metalli]MBB5376003.1 ADP-ribose pyrophosphatase YjhB (NUDIX family) [Deinococcus metalli]GHF41546.1 DNA mismatch repair protein MutT [Deinococcus metalli]